MYEATAATNTVAAGTANTFKTVSGSASAQRTAASGWAFTAAGFLATYTGPTAQFLVRVIATALYNTNFIGVAISYNGDLIGVNSLTSFTGGVQFSATLDQDILVAERVVTVSTGQIVRPIFSTDGSSAVLERLTMTITPTGV